MDAASVQEFDYESAVWGEEALVPGERTLAGYRLGAALSDLPERGKLLELGCGGGRFLRGIAAARPGLALVGIDLSRRALAAAAARTPGAEFRRVESPEAALPATDGEFDALCVFDVLEHVPDPARTLAEVRRVLRAGGIFHLHVPCEGDALSLWRWLPGQRGPRALKRGLAGHVHTFRRAEIGRLLDSAGFTVLRRRHSLHVFGNLADVALFAGLGLRRRFTRARAVTSGTVLAAAAQKDGGGHAGKLAVRAVDRLLWAEATLLARVPAWGLHLTCRRN